MFDKIANTPSAQHEIAQLEHRLIIRGSVLIFLSISMVLTIVGFYLFHRYNSTEHSFLSIVLLAISLTSYILAIPSLYLFKKSPEKQQLLVISVILITLSWVSIGFAVDVIWQVPESAKHILLIGFFTVLLGWHSHFLIISTSLLIIVISYAFIGSTMANLTALDLTLMVLKFPLFILIHYFTVRKLLLDSKQKYLENIQLLKKLSATLHIDELTQVSNRKGFNRDFAIAIQTALRLKTPLSLVILDIDFFKQYNDSLGHPQGDQCLTEVAKVLSENCQRAVDNIARIGGEEFAYILTGSNIEQACAYIEKVQRELAEKGITHPQSKVSQHVTLSAGIALFDPLEDTQESLYQKADRALYKAKEAGRNQYACEQ